MSEITMITGVNLMKRKDLNRKLSHADADGVWAFTPSSFSALMGGIKPDYLKLMMKRLADQGVLTRAVRGVYVNPHARSRPSDVRRALLRFLRPREINYVSLESKLSEAGAISQRSTALTCMTTGSQGRFETPWGTIEFTHTDRKIRIGVDVIARDDGTLEATMRTALRDLRRVGRNHDVIDAKTLTEAISKEESRDEQQSCRP
ncbi:type IV toxin-antitoxin system AbiEi family antitoxin [uncultured Bradyrhizobium sp.]|uniref:type IV toxin-antitoxin system AbiEi family antitoxin n=1 Tax=uncultured Bradyrhizobium sp. TaxID=199684 RepID=UPI0035CC55CB